MARRAEAQSKLRCHRNLSLLSPGGHWTARKSKQGIMRHGGLKTAPLNPSDLPLPAQDLHIWTQHVLEPVRSRAPGSTLQPAGPQRPLSQYKAPRAAGTFCKPDFGQKHQIRLEATKLALGSDWARQNPGDSGEAAVRALSQRPGPCLRRQRQQLRGCSQSQSPPLLTDRVTHSTAAPAGRGSPGRSSPGTSAPQPLCEQGHAAAAGGCPHEPLRSADERRRSGLANGTLCRHFGLT